MALPFIIKTCKKRLQIMSLNYKYSGQHIKNVAIDHGNTNNYYIYN